MLIPRPWRLLIPAATLALARPAYCQPTFTANDFICYISRYAAGDSYANCDGSTGTPTLTPNDFQCFLNAYASGLAYANCDGSGASGWTSLPLPATARAWYVSSTGSDTAAGTQAAPFRTVQRGIDAAVDGRGDQVLLRCGDVWTGVPTIGVTKGANAGYFVIGQYASGPRPLLQFAGTGFRGESTGHRGIAIVGLDIAGAYINDTSGIILLGWRDILVEDCRISRFRDGVVVQGFGGVSSGMKIRRNVIVDQKFSGGTSSGRSQGIYFDTTTNWLIEENTIDQNGIVGSIFSHGVYAQGDNSMGTLRGNILSRNASEGIQQRCGGDEINNLFIENSYGTYHDVGGRIDYNVIMGAKDISATERRGRGILAYGATSGRGNFAGYNRLATGLGNVRGFHLVSVTGLWDNNVCWSWPNPAEPEAQCFVVDGGSVTLNNNTGVQYVVGAWCFEGSLSGTGNRYWYNGNAPRDRSSQIGTRFASQPADPHADIAGYMASLGLTGGDAEFIAAASGNSKQSYDQRFTAASFNAWARKKVGITGGP